MNTTASLGKFILLTSAVGLFFACTAGGGQGTNSDADPGEDDKSNDTIDLDTDDDGNDDIEVDPGSEPATLGCANGVLDADEGCDDGGREDGDGCYGNCREVEPGYICRLKEDGTGPQTCIRFAKCGDGVTAFPEQCDDGNATPGDGCSDNCKIEIGFKCPVEGMPCSATTCGDGQVEGAEMCEVSIDEGCTSECQFAPDCSGDGACTSECGDGLVLGEDCDDGNRQNGDGCDENCKPEQGYDCGIQKAACQRSPHTDECILKAPATFRDFSTAHPDFEACGGTSAKPNLVDPTLTNKKPTPGPSAGPWDAGQCITKLGEWYSDGAHATTFHSSIVLYDDGLGNFVNRYGAMGEKYVNPGCGGCTAGEYDGSPFFYPVDGIPGAKDDGGTFAQISTTEYGMTGGVINDPSGVKRNFAFTSEVEYWFAYEASTNATLKFTGDDDLWVFVNGKLALDLGGVHQAIPGEFSISGSNANIVGGTAAAHGMTPGNVYEIKVFHAERHTTGSSFKLTLSGFDTSRSDCRPECGDGFIAFGEECDDGPENGEGYNRCSAECTLGSYCGDGVVDPGEDCDPGSKKDGTCTSCRILVVR